jgi:hypothetical protein
MDVIQLGEDVLKALQDKGWDVQLSDSREPLLPPDLRRRYPRLPVELTDFLERIESAANADENIWFLCRADFRNTDAQSFRWNEFELMLLENDDAKQQAETRRFWDLHFPFMLATHSDYDYLAVSLEEQSYGQVVHGCELELQEPSVVAPSLAEFLALFKETAAGRRNEYPLTAFV